MPRHTVLVVDDEVKMQRVLEIMLDDMGLDVLRADNGQAALDLVMREQVDLIITDMRMPVMDGITLVRTLHERNLLPPTIVITAHGTVESAVAAMRYGAVDYLMRPFEVETVELAVRRALNLGHMQRENRFLREALAQGWQDFIGRSAVMRELYQLIDEVAPANVPVLIVGETGTGKELVARAIHQASKRAGLFVAINCAAVPDNLLESELFGHVRGAFTGAIAERVGKFEAADGGTLFLDEITEMPATLQARLLRVLQESVIERLGSNRAIELDLRVIAATNREPRLAVAEQRLREDLFYRLDGFRIDVPPLRARGEDIELLAEHFLEQQARGLGREPPQLSSFAREALRKHAWPGNVRELENLMARVALVAPRSDPDTVLARELGVTTPSAPLVIGSAADADNLHLQPRIDALERQLIEAALAAAHDNKARAARLLDVSERTLWYKLKKLDIK
ncbi:MAG: sigma-54-dependent Fis family transcriptional regulator [Gammaproteobacteria bacterium]|nr:sigma-54-dependent Fis family transcriptional regulator [Gammaproteobacteria bacterium]